MSQTRNHLYKYTIPLVLHRVVEGEITCHEDVNIQVFNFIVETIKNSIRNDNKAYSLLAKKCFLTFDDGYSSDYEIVFPMLKDAGLKAVFFIVTNFIGSPGYLTWQQIKEMQKYGMDFGSHSLSHKSLTTLTDNEVLTELTLSRELIEQKTGARCIYFSFPFGSYNNKLLHMAQECGYESCFLSDHGVVKPPQKVVPRNSINGTMNEAKIKKIMNASFITRIQWIAEDMGKYTLRKLLGDTLYRTIRSIFS